MKLFDYATCGDCGTTFNGEAVPDEVKTCPCGGELVDVAPEDIPCGGDNPDWINIYCPADWDEFMDDEAKKCSRPVDICKGCKKPVLVTDGSAPPLYAVEINFYGGDRTRDGLYCEACAVFHLQIALFDLEFQTRGAIELARRTAGVAK